MTLKTPREYAKQWSSFEGDIERFERAIAEALGDFAREAATKLRAEAALLHQSNYVAFGLEMAALRIEALSLAHTPAFHRAES